MTVRPTLAPMFMPHRAAALAASALLLASLAGCSGAAGASPTPTKPATVTAHGSMTISGYGNMLWGADGSTDGGPCHGAGGFTDMTAGAAVVVTDPKGKTVGTGALEEGVDPQGGSRDFTCIMQFTVPDLPAGLASYGFHVGNAARGVLVYKASDLPDVELTVGS